MKGDLEQQIAQFVFEIGQIPALDGIRDFVCLLDRIGRHTGEILFEIPRTARVGIAQSRHDLDEFVDYSHVCHGKAGSPIAKKASLSSVSRRL